MGNLGKIKGSGISDSVLSSIIHCKNAGGNIPPIGGIYISTEQITTDVGNSMAADVVDDTTALW